MSRPVTRHLLLDQARLQLRLACQDAEDAVTPMGKGLEALMTLLSQEGALDESLRQEALDHLLGLFSHLQFHDRQRQRMEHIDLALTLAQEGSPGEADLDRLAQALTLPEEQQTLRRLRQGEKWEAILADPPLREDPDSELF